MFRINEEIRTNPYQWCGGRPIRRGEAWLLGDVCESTWWSSQTLESRLETAVSDDRWRESVSGGIARRVRESLTYESAAGEIVEMIRGALECAANPATCEGHAAREAA